MGSLGVLIRNSGAGRARTYDPRSLEKACFNRAKSIVQLKQAIFLDAILIY